MKPFVAAILSLGLCTYLTQVRLLPNMIDGASALQKPLLRSFQSLCKSFPITNMIGQHENEA
jgi:hypothetical protein